VVVADVALPGSSARIAAPFFVWFADDDPVFVHALVDQDPADEVAFALMNAMTAPVLGSPRRPRLVLVENDAMAVVLRSAREHVGHELAGLIDIRVERDPGTAELAQTFVQIHADSQADDAGEGDPS
jgi:hypothetical protein